MKSYIKIIFFGILIIVSGYNSVFAAKIFITQEEKVGLIIVDVMLDTEGQSVNAMSGSLYFDSSVLGNPSIHTEDSIINNWIVSPTVDQLHSSNSQSISWSGIIPGGFAGVRSPFYSGIRPGRILQIVFTPLVSKNTDIFVNSVDLKANDGLATTIPVKDAYLSFGINYSSSNIDKSRPLVSENLHATISRDKAIFNNKYFIAFSDSEQAGTIDHYEIAESNLDNINLLSDSDWKRITSPSQLSDQSRNSFVYLKAVGRDGSTAYITIYPEKNIYKTKYIFVYVIITILILILFILFKRILKKRFNNHK